MTELVNSVDTEDDKARSNGYGDRDGDAHCRKEVLLSVLNRGVDGLQCTESLTKCKDSVCYIYSNGRDNIKRGSGFFARISINGKEHNCIATNNHVICRKEEADAGTARFHYEGESPGEEVRLLPDQLFITDKVLDYTFIGCDHEYIEHILGISPLEFGNEPSACIGDDIFIFQHPKGESKKFSYQKISNIERPFVFYQADTDIGSSGSPVLRKFKLLAIHSKGSDSLKYNKGALCSEILQHVNFGTYTNSVMLTESADQTRKREGSQDDVDHSPSKKQRTEVKSPNSQPSEDHLHDLAKEIVAYWKHLGRKLKVPNSRLEGIQKDHMNYDDITEKSFAMLLDWREKGPASTFQQLSDALKALGKVDTALKYCGV